MSNRKAIAVWAPVEYAEALAARAKHRGITVSDLMRELIAKETGLPVYVAGKRGRPELEIKE